MTEKEAKPTRKRTSKKRPPHRSGLNELTRVVDFSRRARREPGLLPLAASLAVQEAEGQLLLGPRSDGSKEGFVRPETQAHHGVFSGFLIYLPKDRHRVTDRSPPPIEKSGR